jgi:hypothetical protein
MQQHVFRSSSRKIKKTTSSDSGQKHEAKREVEDVGQKPEILKSQRGMKSTVFFKFNVRSNQPERGITKNLIKQKRTSFQNSLLSSKVIS